ncbi:MAG: glycerate kinase [Bacteroidetes bacterium]|nr:glycerate kinase [Bacteroidota bacterium]
MHILIAPNAFKNSLDATAVADAIRKGLEESLLSCTCTVFPIGDGGDGTAALLLQNPEAKIITVAAHDPIGRKINSSFGLIDDGRTAVIEMADASGLRLLQRNEYDPMHATTFGTGELITAALDHKVNKIILGIGGSATVDGASGLLKSLGVKFLDKNKQPLENLPADLIYLEHIDLSGIDQRIFNTELVVLCDVDNKLLGENGAAYVFGPQKGADKNAVKKLDAALEKFRNITLAQTGVDIGAIKYGGAAGGTAAGVAVFLLAKLVNGIEYFLDFTHFNERLEKANLLITGEGSIDLQTLQGKAPFGVARRAKEKNIPVIGMAGKIPDHIDIELKKYFDVLMPINNELTSLDEALKNTASNLTRTAKMIGDVLIMFGRVSV